MTLRPSSRDALLADRFILYGSGREYDVQLFADCLRYRPCSGGGGGRSTSKEKLVLLADVIGVQCMKGKTSADCMGYLTIYAYPRGKTLLTGNLDPQRRRTVVVFVVSRSHVFPENLDICQVWKTRIMDLARPESKCWNDKNLRPASFQNCTFAATAGLYSGTWMVVINPAGGQGKAVRIFQERVLPILAEAEIRYEVVVSERAGHVKQLMTFLDLAKYSAVVIVSGDGLIHEAINGLMSRSDWSDAIRTPLGIIPGGSGNALAASIHEACGEPFLKDFAKHAALLLAHSLPTPLDLFHFESVCEQRYGFLSFGWGIIADIDIESEKFRQLGESRFTLGGLQRVLDLRTYSGTLSYLPPTDLTGQGDSAEVSPTPHESSGKPETVLLPPLGQPVPDSWKTVEGDFVSVFMASVSRLASSSVAIPWAKLNDGLMYLFWMKAGAPKLAVVKFLIDLGTGEHVNSAYVQVAACRAFRLEPRDKDGIMTVDGERVAYGAVQGQVLPSLGRVLSRNATHS